jgi:hypothetical protein
MWWLGIRAIMPAGRLRESDQPAPISVETQNRGVINLGVDRVAQMRGSRLAGMGASVRQLFVQRGCCRDAPGVVQRGTSGLGRA